MVRPQRFAYHKFPKALLYSSRPVTFSILQTHQRGMAVKATTALQGLPTTELTPPLIASICAPIFDELKPRYPHLAWVGLFGSVGRGTQRPDSDIDIVIGHDAAASFMADVGGSMYELTDSLPNALGREVDIVHFTKGTPMGYVQMEALLTSKTIWGDGSMFAEDQAAATIILADAYERVSKAARIYREEIIPKLPSSTDGVVSSTTQSQILSSVIEIIELLRFEHLHPFHYTTERLMAWIFEQERAVRSLMQAEEGSSDTTTLHKLWTTLSDTINRISLKALVQATEQTLRRARMNKKI